MTSQQRRLEESQVDNIENYKLCEKFKYGGRMQWGISHLQSADEKQQFTAYQYLKVPQ